MEKFVQRTPPNSGAPQVQRVVPGSPLSERNPGNCEGFDRYSGQKWIYPNNMPIRNYQKTAVEHALFTNMMIALPTGFGKTFIAAVVMYNFYRWYPQGKIIFVAPTKPLVRQQISECKKISGIPPSDCIEITGSTSSQKRSVFWESKRVFFATPQVIENDLNSDILPANQVRCIIIDEAHKATGDYAYVGIVRQLNNINRNGFRILALTATPGSDIQKVQQLMLKLYIGDVMFRSENSIDLMQYKNEKCAKAYTVELTSKHKEFVNKMIKIAEPVFKDLCRAGLTYGRDSLGSVAKYTLVQAAQRIRTNDAGIHGRNKGKLGYYCSVALSLAMNFEYLTLYGIRVFYESVTRNLNESRSALRSATASSVEFDTLMSDIKTMFGEDVDINPHKVAKADLIQSHPKLNVLKNELMKHFEKNHDKTDTRVMVFSKYRESVNDIVQMLKSYEPVIKAGAFVGQSKSGKDARGMSQKEQIQVVKDFKEGKYNVLVATCVAEEGLDIGEVDLIICYDSSSSPISTTQRRGRTGRKRAGDIITLCTKDYEEKKVKKASESKRQVEDQLFKRDNYMSFKYRDAPRMVPLDVKPICLEQKIFPIEEDVEVEEAKPKRKRTAKASKKLDDDSEDADDVCKSKKPKCEDKAPIPVVAAAAAAAEEEDDDIVWENW